MDKQAIINEVSYEEFVFAIKLHKSVEIEKTAIEEIGRSLAISHPNHFSRKSIANIKNTFIIAGGQPEKDERQITINETTVQYKERKILKPYEFNNLCDSLFKKYSKITRLENENIRLMGIIRNNRHELDSIAINLMKEKVNIFKDDKISRFDIGLTIVENKFNIHFNMFSKNEEETGIANLIDDDKNTLSISVDINNVNQLSPVGETFKTELFDFVDDFFKNRYVSTINQIFLDK
jgi:hypothetical protein